ncbi:MAG: PfkB family carbohydrate kinase [Candidatus Cloacimonetes bacterium]|jgi:sugar/nucleoside kinase (ribokinase family)|nr:PfkB family carbohydrate kinase [Candidatus Cloacimonadota bacterium]MDD4155910.1 PfkB family carbohydrate kinase [Candidatus Cloacimonadota bacterium]
MDLVIVGSVAIDDVKTPSGHREYSVGGSALFASIAAAKFTSTGIVGVVGEDFPEKIVGDLKKQQIDLSGLEKVEGKTFRWKGEYCDLNKAETKDTQLNVFADFCPKLPETYKNAKYLFLGNIHPQLQLDVINQCKAEIIACDTMNFWINGTPELLNKVIKKVQILFINEDEIRLLTKKQNIFDAADEVLKQGPKLLIIKRGEYGAIAYSKDLLYFSPVYPVRQVVDPTGAGDSFAGGFLGYIVKHNTLDSKIIKQAMIYGTVTASINIESFSFDRLISTNIEEIENRVDFLKKIISVE